MNLDEIREAVLFINAYLTNYKKKEDADGIHVRSLETLLPLAQSVLDAEWPERMPPHCGDPICEDHDYEEGWNEAIDPCLVAHTKAMMEKDEIIQKLELELSFAEGGKGSELAFRQACIDGLKDKIVVLEREIAELKEQLKLWRD